MPDDTLHFETDPERMRRFCRSITRATSDHGRLLTILTGVKTFLGASSGPDIQVGRGYREVQRILDDAIDAAQARVIEEKARALASATLDQAPGRIAAIHGSLSRGGFALAFEQAFARLNTEERQKARAWSEGWRQQAWARAEAASGYPDAPDFVSAGIDHREYAAIADLAGLLVRHLDA